MASSVSNASLLAGSAAYAISCVRHVTPGVLSWPTPCAGWDVTTLLRHVNDSLTAVHEGIAAGNLGPGPADPAAGNQGMSLVATFCDLACGLLAASVTADNQHRPITIADRSLPASTLISVAAVEVAVHGWDIACACQRRRPIPPALATGLLQVVPPLVPPAARNALFAAPVPLPPRASPSDQLIAWLGRNPQRAQLSRA
jgi:uncharacterized protein (TIGR03086 family)